MLERNHHSGCCVGFESLRLGVTKKFSGKAMNSIVRVTSLLLGAYLASWLPHCRADCRDDSSNGSPNSGIIHFTSLPPTVSTAIGFQFADLQDSGSLELIQGGTEVAADEPFYQASISLLFARTRVGEHAYTTRSVIPLMGEYLVSAIPAKGSLFGMSGTVVVLVTRAKDVAETRVRVIDGMTWKSVRLCTLEGAATKAAIGPDTDAGPARLYLQDAQAIRVLSLPDLAPLRSLPASGVPTFAIAQLDDDADEEIILGGTPGRVIDALSGAVKWEYADGFGQQIVVGHFGLTVHDGFATADGLATRLFSGSPYALAWSVPQPQYPIHSQVIAAGDVNGDGRDEVIESASHPEGNVDLYVLRAYDSLTQDVLINDAEVHSQDIRTIAVGPDRGNGALEIVEGLENYWGMRTHSLGNSQDAWLEPPAPGPFVAFAAGDFAGDGTSQILFSGLTPGWLPVALHLLDEQWHDYATSPPNVQNQVVPVTWLGDFVGLRVAGSPARKVAIGGSAFFGALAVVQPESWTLDWQMGTQNDPVNALLGDRHVGKVLAYDFDHDGTDDVLAGASPTGGSPWGAMVGIFSGVDGTELWHSEPLGGTYANLADLEIVPASLPGHDLLIAVAVDVIYAFDMQTGAQLWTIDLHQQFGPSVTAVSGLDGGRLAVAFADGTVRAFDENQAPLFAVGAHGPIGAIAQPIAGGPILVASASRFRWLDRTTGALLATSLPIASSLASGNRWKLTVDSTGHSLDVIAGSDAGLFEVVFAMPSGGEIFGDLFE